MQKTLLMSSTESQVLSQLYPKSSLLSLCEFILLHAVAYDIVNGTPVLRHEETATGLIGAPQAVDLVPSCPELLANYTPAVMADHRLINSRFGRATLTFEKDFLWRRRVLGESALFCLIPL